MDFDPQKAATPTEFTALMQALKEWSGRTYREIAKRAERNGDNLPASTAQDMLRRDSLPREEQVTAFVRACGLSEEDAANWVLARKRIAAGPIEVSPPSRKPRAAWLRYSVVGAGVVMVLSVSAPLTAIPQPQASPSAVPESKPLRDGAYRISMAYSGLCLTEKQKTESGRVYQANCKEAFVKRSLAKLANGRHLIRTLHPEYGPGCMGVSTSIEGPGALVVDGYCGDGMHEELVLEPVTQPLRGFRLRSVHSGLCLGIQPGTSGAWALLVQFACDAGDPTQVFTFDLVGTDHT